MSGVELNPDRIRAKLEKEMMKRVFAAGLLVSNEAKKLVNVDGRVKEGGPVKRGEGGKFLKRKTFTVRSKPGEPPRKQRGQLLGSIKPVQNDGSVKPIFDGRNITCKVGTPLMYGYFLEVGTTKRGPAARPWLRRAFFTVQDRVKQILMGR